MSNDANAEKTHPETHVEVQIVTTSGKYPDAGFDDVPANQKIRVELEKAARKLSITDTTGWVATIGDRELSIDQSYRENGQTGKIVIDYGPQEGGGGCE
jgi:hypothetical protein